MNKLSIVIPTVKYTEFLDVAIESCLKLQLKKEVVVSINGINSDGYERSPYFNDDRVVWRCIGQSLLPMYESLNYAISFANNDWVFILSDDDFIHDNFLEGISLDDLDETDLYATTVNTINENNVVTGESIPLKKSVYVDNEIINLFFNNKIHNHLSLFVFNKKMFIKCGKFMFTGYPNSYYLDTVLHGKLMANATKMYVSRNAVVSRREFSAQASAKFYFDDVNEYFDVIVNALVFDEKFRSLALEKYYSKEVLRKVLLRSRFFSEWSKLNKDIYNKSWSKKFEFYYKFLRHWNCGLLFKIFSFLYISLLPIKKYLPQTMLKHIKISLTR